MNNNQQELYRDCKIIYVPKEPGHLTKVRLSSIMFVTARRNYCIIQTVREEILLTLPMCELEDCLNKYPFFHIGRSHIINIDYLDDIVGLIMIFKTGRTEKRITISQNARKRLPMNLPIVGPRKRVMEKRFNNPNNDEISSKSKEYSASELMRELQQLVTKIINYVINK